MFNLGMICVLIFQLHRLNREHAKALTANLHLLREMAGFAMLVGMLIDRSAGMISCDVCHESIRSDQHLRTDIGPDLMLLAHAGCE